MQHELITLYKQDGRPVRVNENSLNAAIALGWLEEKPQSEADKLEADKLEADKLEADKKTKKSK